MQVQDGNIVIGGSQTLIEGLTQHARVTRANEEGLVLGFELQDGPKSMVDIALGKVATLTCLLQLSCSAPCVVWDSVCPGHVLPCVRVPVQRQ